MNIERLEGDPQSDGLANVHGTDPVRTRRCQVPLRRSPSEVGVGTASPSALESRALAWDRKTQLYQPLANPPWARSG